MSLPQEGMIERHAVAGLHRASAGGRCDSPGSSVPKAVARTVSLLAFTNQVGSAGTTSPGTSSNAGQPAAKSPNRGGAHPKAGGQPSNPQLRSASISRTARRARLVAARVAHRRRARRARVRRRSAWPAARDGRGGTPGARRPRRASEVGAGGVRTQQLRQGARALAARSRAGRPEGRGLASSASPSRERQLDPAAPRHQPVEAVTPAPADRNEVTAEETQRPPVSPPSSSVERSRRKMTWMAPRRRIAAPTNSATRRRDQPRGIARASPRPRRRRSRLPARRCSAATPMQRSTWVVCSRNADDLAAAETAYRSADRRGTPPAPRTWPDCSSTAATSPAPRTRTAEPTQRGEPDGAFRLGGLLAERNDPAQQRTPTAVPTSRASLRRLKPRCALGATRRPGRDRGRIPPRRPTGRRGRRVQSRRAARGEQRSPTAQRTLSAEPTNAGTPVARRGSGWCSNDSVTSPARRPPIAGPPAEATRRPPRPSAPWSSGGALQATLRRKTD